MLFHDHHLANVAVVYESNCVAAYRCYQNVGIGDEGEEDLHLLKDLHAKLLKRKETLEAESCEMLERLECDIGCFKEKRSAMYAEDNEEYSREFQSEYGSDSERQKALRF